MVSRTRYALLLTVCLLLSSPFVAASPNQTVPPEAAETTYLVNLHADGSAQIFIHYRFNLSQYTAQTEFYEYHNNSSRVSALAAATDRDVRTLLEHANATSSGPTVNRTATSLTTTQNTGYITFRYSAPTFAEQTANRTLSIQGNFSQLNALPSVTLRLPRGYHAASVSPGPTQTTDRTLSWNYHYDFSEVAIVLLPEGQSYSTTTPEPVFTPTTTETTQSSSTTTSDPAATSAKGDRGWTSSPILPLLFAILGGIAVLLWRANQT